MIFEFTYNTDKGVLTAALVDPANVVEESTAYWIKYGITKGSYGKFEFHRSPKDELICLVATTNINKYALEYLLSCIDQTLGVRLSIPQLIDLIDKFNQFLSSNSND